MNHKKIIIVLLIGLVLISGCIGGSDDSDARTYQLKYGQPPPQQTPRPQISPEMQAYGEELQSPFRTMGYIILAMGAYYIFSNRERILDRYKGEAKLPIRSGSPILLRHEGIFEITHNEPMGNGMTKFTLDDGYKVLEHQVYDEGDLIAPEALQFINSRHPLLIDFRWLTALMESFGIELDISQKLQIKSGLEHKSLNGLLRHTHKKKIEQITKDSISTVMESEVGRRVNTQLNEVKSLLEASQDKGGVKRGA